MFYDTTTKGETFGQRNIKLGKVKSGALEGKQRVI